jgi:hypothetical protein
VAADSGTDSSQRSLLDIDYPRALLVSLLAVLIIAVVVAASTSGAAFGTYNPAWDGAAELRGAADGLGVENEIALNTTQYETVAANETVALVLSPDSPYTDREAAQVRRFVAAGGTLVIAEDFGSHSNALLAAIGATARFDGAITRDERYTYQSPAMPLARNVSNHTLTTGVSRLTLNHATVIEPNEAQPVVTTSGFAYLDRNRNEELDDNESLGAYPVVTVEAIGQGEVVAVSDPSLFINAMADRSGNRAFILNAFGAGEQVLLDYSHAAQLPPLALALTLVRGSPALQVLVVGGLVSLAAVWGQGRLGARLRRSDRDAVATSGGPSPDALTTYLTRQHPDWEESQVRRVVEGHLTGRDELHEDE